MNRADHAADAVPVDLIRRTSLNLEKRMPIGTLRSSLYREISAPTYRVLFESIAKHHPILRAHETPNDLMAFFREQVAETLPEKESLVRLMLVEYQRTHHRLWSSLLTLVFLPALISLECQLRATERADGEAGQKILFIFLEVIASYDVARYPDSHTFIRIVRQVRRRFFRQLKVEQNQAWSEIPHEPDVMRYLVERQAVDEGHAIWPRFKVPESELTREERAAQTDFLERVGAHVLSGDRLRLLMKTQIGGESLRKYLRRRNPDLPEDAFERLYQRIKRQHSRDVKRLRDALAHVRRPRTPDAEDPSTDVGDEPESASAG